MVDDNHTAATVLSDMLMAMGFEVDQVYSGLEALQTLRESMDKQRPYGLLLLDWHMPGMDGVELARHIRSLGMPQVPQMLMVTAYGREDVMRAARAEGIETVEHGSMLIHLGCDQGQGNCIARPMPGDRLPAWVRDWQAPAAWLEAVHWPPEDSALLTVEIDHIRWIRQFATLIEAPPGQSADMPELDPTACRFGQWLIQDGLRRYRHLPNFAGIVPTHDAVHQLASELLALHAVEPEAARARLGELFALRDRLVAELRALREAVLRSGFNTDQEGVG